MQNVLDEFDTDSSSCAGCSARCPRTTPNDQTIVGLVFDASTRPLGGWAPRARRHALRAFDFFAVQREREMASGRPSPCSARFAASSREPPAACARGRARRRSSVVCHDEASRSIAARTAHGCSPGATRPTTIIDAPMWRDARASGRPHASGGLPRVRNAHALHRLRRERPAARCRRGASRMVSRAPLRVPARRVHADRARRGLVDHLAHHDVPTWSSTSRPCCSLALHVRPRRHRRRRRRRPSPPRLGSTSMPDMIAGTIQLSVRAYYASPDAMPLECTVRQHRVATAHRDDASARGVSRRARPRHARVARENRRRAVRAAHRAAPASTPTATTVDTLPSSCADAGARAHPRRARRARRARALPSRRERLRSRCPSPCFASCFRRARRTARGRPLRRVKKNFPPRQQNVRTRERRQRQLDRHGPLRHPQRSARAVGSAWSTAIRAIVLEIVPQDATDIVLGELPAAASTTVLAVPASFLAMRKRCESAPVPNQNNDVPVRPRRRPTV